MEHKGVANSGENSLYNLIGKSTRVMERLAFIFSKKKLQP